MSDTGCCCDANDPRYEQKLSLDQERQHNRQLLVTLETMRKQQVLILLLRETASCCCTCDCELLYMRL